MGPGDFEVLEHPADIGFRAFGGTLPDLFTKEVLVCGIVFYSFLWSWEHSLCLCALETPSI